MLFSSLYFIVSATSFVINVVTSDCGIKNQRKLYNRGKVSRKVILRIVFKFWSKIFLPILRNSLSSSDSAFMLIPKTQLPITSVENLAVISRQSMKPPFSITFSKHCSKFSAHSNIRGNISLSLPEVNTGESFVRKGLHLLASTLKRFVANASVCD